MVCVCRAGDSQSMIALSPPPTASTLSDSRGSASNYGGLAMDGAGLSHPSTSSSSPASSSRPSTAGAAASHYRPAQIQRLRGTNTSPSPPPIATSSNTSPSLFSNSVLSSPTSTSTPLLNGGPPSGHAASYLASQSSPSANGLSDPFTFTRKPTASPKALLNGLPPPSARPSFSYSSPAGSNLTSHLARATSPEPNAPSSSLSQALQRVHGSTTSLASTSSLAPSGTVASSTVSGLGSRHSSRRPSLVTLQSFLEGVNHVTRVRSPSLRGHSRAGSTDESLTGSTFLKRDDDRPWHLDDVDEVPSWEEHQQQAALLTPNSPTPRRHGFYSRNPSFLSLRREELFVADREPNSMQTSPVPIRTAIPLNGLEDDDDLGERTFVDRREGALFPKHVHMHVDDEDEEKHLRNLEESLWSEKDLSTFIEGDRLGIGLDHDGFPIVDALEGTPDSPWSTPDDGIQFEVVRQLGYGSYAIVYLVKEVLYDHTEDDGMFPHDDNASFARSHRTVYGREFALKCLSKKNLTEDQIAVQKFEATLHRALPQHPNVVALHKAMETPAWLFLVLEYCPGQDLFFWLEQAKDTEGIDSDPSRAPSRLSSRAPVPSAMVNKHFQATVFDPPLGQSPAFGSFLDEKQATPPSPSLLAANAESALLSRRRLRLISRMFVQMCEAMQACHDAGVCHRDIKPENIIIVDNRAEQGASGKVVIKITDWGLGTVDERCEDFDCGSKPYMAYECRNNLSPSYEPKGADVWSLGIVLLNLLFHRCPWSDPTEHDPDFAAFRRAPVEFLETRFAGIGFDVANFLASRVFCDVVDGTERVTAGEFAKWASKLVRYMGEGARRASISDATVQLVQTVRQSPRLEGTRVFNSPQTRSPRHSFQLNSPDADGIDSPTRKPYQSMLFTDDSIEELDFRTVGPFSDEYLNHQKDSKASGGDATAIEDLERDVHDLDLEEAEGEEGASKDTSSKPRRRKRGTRKKHRPDGTHSHRSSDLKETTADDEITEVSQTLQEYAREISKATSPITSGSNTPAYSTEASTIRAKPSKSRFADKLKGAFANGNADLQAFTERARQRELALTGQTANPTASAPAKMQHEANFGAVSGQLSSFGSVASTGSWSEDRGSSHWASTGNRRERQHKRGEPGMSRSHDRAGRPSRLHHRTTADGSADVSASSSPSRQSSPLSSWSSSTSYGQARPGLSSIHETVNKAVYGAQEPSASDASLQEARDAKEIAAKLPPQLSPPVSYQVPPVQAPPNMFPGRAARADAQVPVTQIIREPTVPPVQPPSPAQPAPKAKIGRFFNKFSRN